jgi:Ca-activated chloride channel family protein
VRWAEPERLLLLWLLPVVLGLLIWAARRRARLEADLGEPSALRELTGDPGRGPRLFRGALLLLALAVAGVGLARPQSGFRLVTTTTSGADVVFVLDLSYSMGARDVAPDRLGAARREIRTMLDILEGSPMGLVVFAGEGKLISPLSTDREGLASLVESVRPEDAGRPGSDIEDGLALAARFIRRPGERPRAVVLVSDGENLTGDPRMGAQEVRRAGARLFVLGMGGTEGAAIPIVDSTGAVLGEKRDPAGEPVRTKLDETLLRDLARRGGGRYERADGSGRAAVRAADAIRSGGNTEVRGRSIRAYDERYPWFAAAAGLLLLAERVVPRRRKR